MILLITSLTIQGPLSGLPVNTKTRNPDQFVETLLLGLFLAALISVGPYLQIIKSNTSSKALTVGLSIFISDVDICYLHFQILEDVGKEPLGECVSFLLLNVIFSDQFPPLN